MIQKLSTISINIYHVPVSKRDLKPPRTFFPKNACDPGFAAYEIFVAVARTTITCSALTHWDGPAARADIPTILSERSIATHWASIRNRTATARTCGQRQRHQRPLKNRTQQMAGTPFDIILSNSVQI